MVPFTSAQAVARGISRNQLRSIRYRRIFRDVYVDATEPDSLELRCHAALLLHPEGAVISHVTAARVVGLPVDDSSAEVHVTVARPGDRRRRAGIVNHVAITSSRRHRQLPVATGADLFAQLAESLALVDLVVAGDAMVKRGWLTPASLVAGVARARGATGALARRAAALVRAEVDSPMETRLRLLLVFAGLPEPTINHKIRDELGHVIFRFDLCYLELKLIVEYDGRQHREDLNQWDVDIDRREWMDAHGWRLIVVVARDIYRRPQLLLDRVAHAMRARGASVPEIDPTWREHFRS